MSKKVTAAEWSQLQENIRTKRVEAASEENHNSQLYREENYEHSFGTTRAWMGVNKTSTGLLIDAGEYDRYEQEISVTRDEAEELYKFLKDYLGH